MWGLTIRGWSAILLLGVTSFNLYSYDAHTRRSRLLFKRVLGSEFEVGSIAHPTISYDPKRWFIFSEGIRTILSETLGYFYARFVYWQK